VGFNVVAPAYFATLGTPLLAGREFDEHDTGSSLQVAIVNERFARRFFGDSPALGRRITMRSLDAGATGDVTYEIVGVVRDAKYQNLRDDVMETMYVCWTQRQTDYPGGYSYFARAASGDPLGSAPDVARLVRAVDPGLHVRNTFTYAAMVDRTIVTERIMATLGGFFGILGLAIAGVGLFGVLAFQVARRTHEIGVRMALGASRGSILQLVWRDVAWTVVTGVAAGTVVALMVTGLASRFLFGLRPNDPGVFIIAGSLLATVAILAAWLPARRAARVDPLVALRHE
jgi:predicted permease